MRVVASKAGLADYLEAQADELERLARDGGPAQQVIVAIMAERLGDVAREHGLGFVAERFDRFRPPAATGTEGG